jgi:hypothetical protein
MTNASFRAFCDSLVGTWVGHRRTADLEHELVHSRWRRALDDRFLQEDWCTAGGGSAPEPTAQAFFGISDAGPEDFIAVYRSGRIAFGESTFVDSEWRLTHRWLREPGVAAIRLKLIDGDTYEQEVVEVAPDGGLKLESRAVLKRERMSGLSGADRGL